MEHGRENCMLMNRNVNNYEGPDENGPSEQNARAAAGEAAIIVESSKLRDVLAQAEMVAPTDCPVLLQGETGTGKEVIAEMIHNRSPRRDYPLIKINCAAIPAGLLESELFGHERGAFTGALAQRIGRFELADRGTLFLDEVGDIPLELQPKLLRVLQEQQFERLGSTRSIRTHVRMIAATHRNLLQMVDQEKFRMDLFYRLHVFPIIIPPLRERTEDIPPLIRYFADKYAKRFHRDIKTVPAPAVESLVRYSWPGNIRELQNFIERTVVLSRGPELEPPLKELIRLNHEVRAEPVTLKDVERAHILRTLEKTNGQLAGAAVMLGIPRSTLFYRIRRLGIALPRAHKARKMTAESSRVAS
jgi:formate hydrogenlyase transcriptional activator